MSKMASFHTSFRFLMDVDSQHSFSQVEPIANEMTTVKFEMMLLMMVLLLVVPFLMVILHPQSSFYCSLILHTRSFVLIVFLSCWKMQVNILPMLLMAVRMNIDKVAKILQRDTHSQHSISLCNHLEANRRGRQWWPSVDAMTTWCSACFFPASSSLTCWWSSIQNEVNSNSCCRTRVIKDHFSVTSQIRSSARIIERKTYSGFFALICRAFHCWSNYNTTGRGESRRAWIRDGNLFTQMKWDRLFAFYNSLVSPAVLLMDPLHCIR